MQSRFECPRCQTVFVKDMFGDAAFVECPSCGALALPVGEATEGFARALSSTHDALTIERPLLDSTSGIGSTDDGVPVDDRLEDSVAPSPGGGLFHNLLEEKSGAALSSPVPVVGVPFTPSIHDENTQTVASAGLTASAPSTTSPLAPAAAPAKRTERVPELEFDFDNELGDGDLGALAARIGPMATARTSRPSTVPTAASTSTTPRAVDRSTAEKAALADLARDAARAPAVGLRGLSDEAFGDLERAFDEVALRPEVAPRGSGLSDDDKRFLRGDAKPSARATPPRKGNDAPPPMRQVAQRPQVKPPPRVKPRSESTHLALSPETQRLAFLSARADGMRADGLRSDGARDDVKPVPLDRTATGPTRTGRDATEPVRAKERVVRTPPRVLQSLSPLRLALLALIGIVLGGAVGAATTPPPKEPDTPRGLAERRYAEGNRFYDEGRFDDALGAYKGAISLDRSFAAAHKAKGAALAKQKRFDEAADAYREFLALDPKAIDAPDAKDAVARRERNPEAH